MATDPLQMEEARAFPFPALAASAAAAPLGGPREAGLAVLMVCRVVADGATGDLDAALRRERAQAARQWLGTLALPLPVRAAAGRALDAAADGARDAVGAGLLQLLGTATAHLDEGAKGEIRRLVTRITG